MPDLSGLIVVFYVALGAVIGALAIAPLAIAAIWIDGLMAWAWLAPVLGIVAGTVAGMIVHGR